MPTYDYRCRGCGHEFEQFQSMKDATLRTCPECGKRLLERLIGTGAAVLFKGSGFYQTDYRSESYKKSAEAESKPASTEKSPEKNSGKSSEKSSGGSSGSTPATGTSEKKGADAAPRTERKGAKASKKS